MLASTGRRISGAALGAALAILFTAEPAQAQCSGGQRGQGGSRSLNSRQTGLQQPGTLSTTPITGTTGLQALSLSSARQALLQQAGLQGAVQQTGALITRLQQQNNTATAVSALTVLQQQQAALLALLQQQNAPLTAAQIRALLQQQKAALAQVLSLEGGSLP
jgi:hypothetical protein